MEYREKQNFKSFTDMLGSSYEALFAEQANLKDQCQKYKEKISHYVEQIKTVTSNLERLVEDMHNNNISFENPLTLTYIVPQEDIKHPLKIDYVADIMDNTVICRTTYSPDGRYLAIGSVRSIRVYNIDGWSQAFEFILEGEQKDVKHMRALAWIPNTSILVSGCEDHMVRIFDIEKNVKIKEIDAGMEVYDIKVSHNGDFFAVAARGKPLLVYSAKTFEKIADLATAVSCEEQFPVCIAISDDDKIIAGGYDNNKVIFWSSETKECVLEKVAHDLNVYSICFYANSTKFASASLDKTIKLWSVSEDFKAIELLKTLTGHSEYVLSIAVDPTSRWLVSGSKDKSVCITDLETMEMTYSLGIHTNSVITVDFCPKTLQFCSGSGDNSIKIWTYQDAEKA